VHEDDGVSLAFLDVGSSTSFTLSFFTCISSVERCRTAWPRTLTQTKRKKAANVMVDLKTAADADMAWSSYFPVTFSPVVTYHSAMPSPPARVEPK
jgi:hypothetical protein